MSKATDIKRVKDLGWDFISASAASGFKGAVNSYKGDKEKVALCFSGLNAYAIKDEQGLFGVHDLVDGVIKCKDVEADAPQSIEGALIIATLAENPDDEEDEAEVVFEEENIKALGLDNFEVKKSITEKLLAIYPLVKLVKVKEN